MNSSSGSKKRYIEVVVTVRIEEGGYFDNHIMIAGDEDDRIKDGDMFDAATVIEDVVRRRISWVQSQDSES